MLTRFFSAGGRLYSDEDGATMVEYAIAVAFIAVVCIAAVMLIGPKVGGFFKAASSGFDANP